MSAFGQVFHFFGIWGVNISEVIPRLEMGRLQCLSNAGNTRNNVLWQYVVRLVVSDWFAGFHFGRIGTLANESCWVIQHNFGAICLDARTLTFCQPIGLPIKPLKVKLLAGEQKATETPMPDHSFCLGPLSPPGRVTAKAWDSPEEQRCKAWMEDFWQGIRQENEAQMSRLQARMRGYERLRRSVGLLVASSWLVGLWFWFGVMACNWLRIGGVLGAPCSVQESVDASLQKLDDKMLEMGRRFDDLEEAKTGSQPEDRSQEDLSRQQHVLKGNVPRLH